MSRSASLLLAIGICASFLYCYGTEIPIPVVESNVVSLRTAVSSILVDQKNRNSADFEHTRRLSSGIEDSVMPRSSDKQLSENKPPASASSDKQRGDDIQGIGKIHLFFTIVAFCGNAAFMIFVFWLSK